MYASSDAACLHKSGYQVFADKAVDVYGSTSAQGTMAGAMNACNADASCDVFTNSGNTYNNVQTLTDSVGSCVYTKGR